MKRWIALLLALTMILCFAACGSTETDEQTPDTSQNSAAEEQDESATGLQGQVIVPAIVSITGSNAAIGEEIVFASQMAVDQINAAGGIGGKELVLDVLDDELTASVALNAAKKAISSIQSNDDYAEVILGPDPSSNILAVLPDTAAANIVVLGSGTNATVTNQGYENIFRFRCTDTVTAQQMANYIVDMDEFDKIGIFYTNEDFGVGSYEAMVDCFAADGIEFAAVETCGIDDTDFSAQIANFKQAGIDCLIIMAKEAASAKFLAQAYQSGLDVQKFCGSAQTSQWVMDLCGAEALEGTYSLVPYLATDPNEIPQQFLSDYTAYTGIESPINHAACYYDMVIMLGQVLNEYGTDYASIVEGFQNIEYEGAASSYRFQSYDDVAGEMATRQAFAQCVDGKWEWSDYVYVD